MDYRLRLQVLQDGKEECFRKLYIAEAAHRESWDNLLEGLRRLENAQDDAEMAFEASEIAWKRYDRAAKEYIPKLDALQTSDKVKSPEQEKIKSRKARALRSAISRPRQKHKESLSHAKAAEEELCRIKKECEKLDFNQTHHFNLLKYANRNYWQAVSAVDDFIKHSKP